MRTEPLTKCFEPLQKLGTRLSPLNLFKLPVIYITDRHKAVLLTWFSFVLSVSVLFTPSKCLDDLLRFR